MPLGVYVVIEQRGNKKKCNRIIPALARAMTTEKHGEVPDEALVLVSGL